MTDIIVSILLLAGAGFMLLASVGIVRLPDLPTRMHASTKAGAMGAMFTMAGVAFFFADGVVLARAFAIVVFILYLADRSSCYRARRLLYWNTTLWSGTIKDELQDNYDSQTHTLRSGYEDSPESVTPPPEPNPDKNP